MIKNKSKAFLCLITSIGFITSIQTINANAMEIQNINIEKFNDTNGHWAESQINNFSSLGYIGGYEDGSFKPNNSITRAEFVKILNNVFGLTTSSGKVFLDTKDHWAKNAIDIAVTNGVCKGKSDTEFSPDSPITREEAAVMIANYKKLTNNNGYNEINKFSDSKDVSDWAKDGVEGSIEQGYMNGYTDNTFKPKGKITRAEAVSTLSRAGKVDDKLDSQTNQEKANEVISKINDIKLNQILDSKEQIINARSAYNNLDEVSKSLVTNLDKLERAETSLNKINNVTNLIQAIPSEIYRINECTDDQVRREFVEYKKQVEKAENAYNSLSEDEKKCITYFDLAILNTGKIMVSQLEEVNVDISKAKNFVNRVNALSTYINYQSQDQINAIAKEINDLRDICKNLPYNMQLVISQDTYQKLFEAEYALLLYNIDQENKQLNQEQANEVISKINDIDFNKILDSKEQIKRARSAYNDLNEGAKSLVTNLEKLESSERVSNVIDLIDNLPIKIELSDEDQVKEVRAAFDDLSYEEQKTIPFTQTGVLESSEATISLLKKEIADKEVVVDLIKRIEDLKGKTINLKEHEAEIKDIRAKYDALEYVRQAEVTNYETFRLIELDLTHIYESIIYLEGLIMDLPETVDLNDSAKVKEAKEKYDNLHENNKVGVKKEFVDKLNKSVEDINRLEEESKVSNQDEANKVISKINGINANQGLSLACEEKITKARSAYNNLNEEAKSLVTNLEKLESSERILDVIKSIYELPEDITLDDIDKVQDVRNAYNSLTDEEKSNITEFDLGILTAAEQKISALNEIKSDNEIVPTLINRINALDSVIQSNDREEVLSKADEIKSIRDSYDSLDYYAKQSVTNYDKLFKAECKLAQML